MARPAIESPPATAVLALVDGEGRIRVRVTPGARTESVSIENGQVLVKTRAKPQDGAANTAVTALLAKALGCAPSRIELLRGATSREKLFRVSG